MQSDLVNLGQEPIANYLFNEFSFITPYSSQFLDINVKLNPGLSSSLPAISYNIRRNNIFSKYPKLFWTDRCLIAALLQFTQVTEADLDSAGYLPTDRITRGILERVIIEQARINFQQNSFNRLFDPLVNLTLGFIQQPLENMPFSSLAEATYFISQPQNTYQSPNIIDNITGILEDNDYEFLRFSYGIGSTANKRDIVYTVINAQDAILKEIGESSLVGKGTSPVANSLQGQIDSWSQIGQTLGEAENMLSSYLG